MYRLRRVGRPRGAWSASGYAGAMLSRSFVALLFAGLLGGALVTGGLRAGDEGPAFLPVLKLPTIGGDPVATSDFRGTRLLLVEFASW